MRVGEIRSVKTGRVYADVELGGNGRISCYDFDILDWMATRAVLNRWAKEKPSTVDEARAFAGKEANEVRVYILEDE